MTARHSLGALPLGVCPQCRRIPLLRFGLCTGAPAAIADLMARGVVSRIAAETMGFPQDDLPAHWITCPDCRVCQRVSPELAATALPGLDMSTWEPFDLTGYRETTFLLDIGPPYLDDFDVVAERTLSVGPDRWLRLAVERNDDGGSRLRTEWWHGEESIIRTDSIPLAALRDIARAFSQLAGEVGIEP